MSQNRQDIREFFKRKRSESPNERSPCVKRSAQDFSIAAASGLSKETAPNKNGNHVEPSGFDGLLENSLKNGALTDRTNIVNKELAQFSSESSEDDTEKNVSSSYTKLSKPKIKKCEMSNSNSSDVEVSFNYSKTKSKNHDDEMGPREFSDEESSSNSSQDKMGPKEFSEEEESEDNDTLDQSNTDKEAVESVNNKSTTSSKGDGETEEYEVEAVLDYQWCKATTQGLYFVKWQGWDESTNTWEPLQNLVGCGDKLKEFYLKRVAEREAAPSAKKRFLEVPSDPRTTFEKRTDLADQICPPPCHTELEAFFERFKTHPVLEWKKSILDKVCDQVSKSKTPNPEKTRQLREQIMLRHLKEKRKEQKQRLKEWEKEINEIDIDSTKLLVENEVDLEGPPRQMTYINAYKPSDGIVIPDDPPLGCECEGGSCELRNQDTCCPNMNGQLFPYTKFGKLRIEPGVPIYECNKRCKCGPNCANRVVQKGRKVKLCIYKTDNGMGWGVKTLENIRKGTFVVEYVGEVIREKEAEERGKKYDAEGRTYLFDLDFNSGSENVYTVDAAQYGNVAHFVNHSCDPNIAVFNVWIDCLDPDLPRLCMFALRDIIKGEQLTFDYRQGRQIGIEDAESEEDGDGEETMECKCGTSRCRKRLFL